MRRVVALIGALGLTALVASPVAAVKPSYGCPPGFDLGQMTYTEFVQLPRIQDGIAAGTYTARGHRRRAERERRQER